VLFRQSRGQLGIDVAKLRIPVGVAIALRGLAVALQAVARIPGSSPRTSQSGDQGAAHLVARPPVVARRLERLRQSAHTLAGPPQRRSRVTARRRFDQRFEIPQQGGIPSLRWGRLLETVVLRPAPGCRTRSEGSSHANSFSPRPIVLGAIPVAVATAAIPP
jgi:hypothetical protein